MAKTAPRSASPSSFLLLFRNTGPDVHAHLTREQRGELTRQWNGWYEGLAAQGKVEQGRPLAPQGRVVSGARGQIVTDGPHAETKELIGGFFSDGGGPRGSDGNREGLSRTTARPDGRSTSGGRIQSSLGGSPRTVLSEMILDFATDVRHRTSRR